MAKVHCRCRECGARQVKPKHPDDYTRGAICRSCRRIGTLRADKWMNNRWRFVRPCGCSGYWFPHRMGSLYCQYRADATMRYPGDTDFKDRHYDPGTEQAPGLAMDIPW